MMRSLLFPGQLMRNLSPIYGEMVEQRLRDELEDVEVRIYRMQMYRLVIPAFLLISLLAVLANLVVIGALRSAKVQRTATVLLLLSLTVSDIWTSFVVSLSLIYNSYVPIVLGYPVNACISLTLELLRSGGMLSATLHLLLIALHHFTGIVRPHTDRCQQLRRTRLACLLAWLGPFSVLLLLSLSIPGQGYWNCQRVEFYHARLFRVSVSVLLVAIFLVISSCYIQLLIILRANRRRFSRAEPCLCARRKSSMEKNRRELRTAVTAILICASFFLGWTPAALLFAATCRECTFLRRESFRTIFLLSCLQLAFILGKSLLNPLIYSLRIPEVDARIREFQRKISQSFGSTFSRLLSSPTVEL